APLCVVHFCQDDLWRCNVVDMHYEQDQKLAQKQARTLFLKINVLHTPFLVTKLFIEVPPCVTTFIDGVPKDKILGLEGIAWEHNFTTEALGSRLGRGWYGFPSLCPLPQFLHPPSMYRSLLVSGRLPHKWRGQG
ncbi:hypothetical protein BT69DRAFT_1210573, partial [Atractiella rhizophila]